MPPTDPEPPRSDSLKTVHDLRSLVGRHFRVYDMRFDENVAVFFVDVDPSIVEERFERLREDLAPHRFVPLLRYEKGEHAIWILRRPQRKEIKVRTNVLLFLATWVTTTLAGSLAVVSYNDPARIPTLSARDLLLLSLSPENLQSGFLLFSLPLMLILTVHELGHFLYTRRHGMEATLPYFIPVPPLFFGALDIGTLGAFIAMRDPIPHRRALLDIGISGPIAGVLVAIPVLLAGFAMMEAAPSYLPEGTEGALIGSPLLFQFLSSFFHFSENQLLSPTAFAGWVGLFVTAINLLPAGQLDGGHVATAILGERSRYLSYGTVLGLLLLGLFGVPPLGIPPYGGWIVFALFVTLLGLPHPPTLNGISRIDTRRVWVGISGAFLFLLCFTPTPLSAGG